MDCEREEGAVCGSTMLQASTRKDLEKPSSVSLMTFSTVSDAEDAVGPLAGRMEVVKTSLKALSSRVQILNTDVGEGKTEESGTEAKTEEIGTTGAPNDVGSMRLAQRQRITHLQDAAKSSETVPKAKIEKVIKKKLPK